MGATVAKQQGSVRECVAERSWRRIADRRKTNWRRGLAWATSERVNAKSKDHPDTQGRARRHGEKVEVLTRGDLFPEKGREVSRGRSSEESRRKTEGAKGRRRQGKALQSIVQGAINPIRQQPLASWPLSLCEPQRPVRWNRSKLLGGEVATPHA